MNNKISHIEICTCEDSFYLSLEEVASSFNVSPSLIIEIVEEGIVLPEGHQQKTWQFDTLATQKMRLAIQLHHDLGVNIAGAALALELLAEIEHLRAIANNTFKDPSCPT